MVVLDSSAVLAFIKSEPGADIVERDIASGLISSVNLAEVLSKIVDRDVSVAVAKREIDQFGMTVVPCTIGHAVIAARLQPVAREFGLSLGDRLCLALAEELQLPVLTADQAWQKLAGNFDIRFIR